MEFDRGDRLKGVTTLIDLYLWLRPRRFVFLSVHLGLTNRAVKCSEEEREKKNLFRFLSLKGRRKVSEWTDWSQHINHGWRVKRTERERSSLSFSLYFSCRWTKLLNTLDPFARTAPPPSLLFIPTVITSKVGKMPRSDVLGDDDDPPSLFFLWNWRKEKETRKLFYISRPIYIIFSLRDIYRIDINKRQSNLFRHEQVLLSLSLLVVVVGCLWTFFFFPEQDESCAFTCISSRGIVLV